MLLLLVRGGVLHPQALFPLKVGVDLTERAPDVVDETDICNTTFAVAIAVQICNTRNASEKVCNVILNVAVLEQICNRGTVAVSEQICNTITVAVSGQICNMRTVAVSELICSTRTVSEQICNTLTTAASAIPENLFSAALDVSALAPVKNTFGKPSDTTLAKHSLLRDPSSPKRKSPDADTDSPQEKERKSKIRAGGFQSDPTALVTFSSSNVRSENAFAQLVHSQKTTALAAEGGNAEPRRMAALVAEGGNAEPSCGEEEPEKEESSESSDDKNSSSDSSTESFSSRSESESGESAPEDGPGVENRGDTALSPIVAAAPGDPEMEVDQDEDVVAAQVAESAPATASAIVVRNPLSFTGSVVGAAFAPP
ncbi:uncharacterized protein LOC113334555 [Papaver somniferum]|uniref:uncharacterized protein LOC113334555 n=1 Tax=Papaver somniferum TaxID=3469 RepID=UPI000E6F93F8|nr:uncharacterized protein LOC113334555 [Papaver somniferum]